MREALQRALEKRDRRRGQPCSEREPYTDEEAQALMRYASAKACAQLGTRAVRKAANKAAWAAGDRSRWGGE